MAQEGADLPGYQRGEPIHDSNVSTVYRARRIGDGAAVVIKQTRGAVTLKDFPIDTLKIDRSFVAEMLTDRTTASIVEVIVSMTRILGLTVLAEGVEDPAQYALLRDLGCDAVQGFYISRPVPADELARLVAGHDGKSLLPGSFEHSRAAAE